MKKTILSLLLALVTSAGAQVKCHIDGRVLTEQWGDDVVICPMGTDLRVADRPEYHHRVVDGRFTADIEAEVPVMYEAYLYEQKEEGTWFSGQFFVEDGTVSLTMPGDRAVVVTSTGCEGRLLQERDSVEQVLIWQEVERIDSLLEGEESRRLYFQPRFIEVMTAMRRSDRDEMPEAYLDSLRREMEYYLEGERRGYTDAGWALKLRRDSITRGRMPFRRAYYAEHPMLRGLYDILASIEVLNQSDVYANFNPAPHEAMIRLYEEQYRQVFPDHPIHRQIGAALTALRLRPGQPYIDYQVRLADGRLVPVSSLTRGRVALIDLWASWCGPCRHHSRAMIPLYNKYKDQGFTVVAIAREQHAEDMAAAHARDGYPWPSLLDLRDELNVWSLNGVGNAGGAMFLLDRDGTILSRSTDAQELEPLIRKALGRE